MSKLKLKIRKKKITEKESFQNTMKRIHPQKKREILTKGGNRNTPPFIDKPKQERSKSAPPLAEQMFKKILKEFKSFYGLDQFNLRDRLNDNFWSEDQMTLKPEIANKLLEIARDFFYSELKFPKDVKIIDIKLTGSLANYNWTDSSDIDLHLVIDFSKASDDVKLIRDYVTSKKNLWNEKHDIMIHGHEVEIYVENIKERHYSTGVFSLANNEWIHKPSKKKVVVDDDQVLNKINSVQRRINHLKDLVNNEEYTSAYIFAERLLEKIRNMRMTGLTVGGEMSPENLAFKSLRRSGAIDEIYEIKYDSYDKKMSLDNNVRDQNIRQDTMVSTNL